MEKIEVWGERSVKMKMPTGGPAVGKLFLGDKFGTKTILGKTVDIANSGAAKNMIQCHRMGLHPSKWELNPIQEIFLSVVNFLFLVVLE